jgi:hypothetical protein
MFDDGVGVVSLVGDDGFGMALAEQLDGRGVVADVSSGQQEVQRQAKLVGEQMNFGRQTSSGTPQSLVRPLFLGPVAAC